MMKNIIAALSAAAMLAPALPYTEARAEGYTGTDHYSLNTLHRPIERLDRGLAAIDTEEGIYLSWRLYDGEDDMFGSAQENTGFIIYRDGEEIAKETQTTNYLDKDGTPDSVYSVAAVHGGQEEEPCEGVRAFSSGENYFDIPLSFIPETAVLPDGQSVEYTPNDCSCGDLDGDGQYEIVVKWTAGDKLFTNQSFAGPMYLDAYKLDGTRLWDKPIALGPNVNASAHTLMFLVYDFDGDGIAEITAQTSAGTTDGNGEYVSLASDNESI